MKAQNLFAVVVLAAFACLVSVGAQARLFPPSSSGSGGGGGLYYALDGSNVSSLAPATIGLNYTTSDPVLSAPAVGFTDGAESLWFSELPAFGGLLSVSGGVYAGSSLILQNASGGASGVTALHPLAISATQTNGASPAFTWNEDSTATLLSSWYRDGRQEGLTVASGPTYSFQGDSNSGLGRTAADTVCLYASGDCKLTANTNEVTVGTGVELWIQTGSAAGPALAWTADTDTGFFRISTGSFGVTTNGTQRWAWSDTGHTSTVPIIHAAGTAALPSLTFSGDLNTGFYAVAADAPGVTAGGTLAQYWTGLSSVLSVRLDPGAAGTIDLGQSGQYFDDVHGDTFQAHADAVGTPSYTWSADTDSGMYNFGANQVGFAVGGQFAGAFGTHATATTTEGFEAPYMRASVFTQINESAPGDLPTCAEAWSGAVFNVDDGTDAGLCVCERRAAVWGWAEVVGGSHCP